MVWPCVCGRILWRALVVTEHLGGRRSRWRLRGNRGSDLCFARQVCVRVQLRCPHLRMALLLMIPVLNFLYIHP